MSEEGFTYHPGTIGGSSGPKGIRMFGGLLYVTASAEVGIDRMQRDVNGRFLPNMQRHVAEANRRMAAELATAMAEKLDETLVRKGASTGRLKEALLDPRNRSADQFGFAVGNVDYLDTSQAKYWRAIEQGTSYFVGKMITGVWGRKTGGPFTPFGERNPNEKLHPMSQKEARRVLRAAGYRRTKGGGDQLRTRGIIQEPIHAHSYMQGAWEGFDMHVRAAQLFREILRELR
jgi:hypothetical protein